MADYPTLANMLAGENPEDGWWRRNRDSEEHFRRNPLDMPPSPQKQSLAAMLSNPGPRPADAMAPVAEMLSPTMGAYGMGNLLADTGMKAKGQDWAGVAQNAPLLAMAAVPGMRRGHRPLDFSSTASQRRVESPGASLAYTVKDDGTVVLESMSSNWTQRGQGHGSRALDGLLSEADKAGRPVHLNAIVLDSEGLSQKALVNFYKRRGFQKAAAPDGNPYLMVRKPKEPS